MRGFYVILLMVVLVIGVGLTFPWLKTPLILAICHGIAALGLSVIMRAGQVSFGHAMYLCLSAYSVAFISKAFPQLDGALLLLLGTLVSLVAGAIVGLFVAKYREIFFGMLNLAISMILFAALSKFYSITGGTDGIQVARPELFGMEVARGQFESLLLILGALSTVLLVVMVERFFRSPTGKMLSAIKTNETRIEYIGVSAKKVFWKGYVISAGLCGFSGGLFALIQGLVTPEVGYWLKSGELVFIAILGGAVHAAGVFMGALVYEFVKLYAAVIMADYWHILLGAVLILMIYFAPGGIAGWLRSKRFI